MRWVPFLVAIVLAAGCAGPRPPVIQHEVIRVPLPDWALAPCEHPSWDEVTADLGGATWAAVESYALQLSAALQDCAAQVEAIRNHDSSPATPQE